MSVHRSIRWSVPVFYGTFPLGIAPYDQERVERELQEYELNREYENEWYNLPPTEEEILNITA